MLFRYWDHIRDWVLLAVFLLVSVVMMLAHNDPMLRGMRAVSLEVTGYVEARIASAGQFVRAIDENEFLRRENITLNSQLARLRAARLENEQLTAALAFQEDTTYEKVAARIITKDIFGQNNFLTLDVGRNSGVEVDMPVVDERGILGRVVLVSARHSRVMPYLNTGFHVPATIQSLFAVGMISWPGVRSDALLLEDIAKTVNVEVGQLVVTSRESGIFPAGYPVGTISAVANRPGENALSIDVRPISPLHRAQYAFVLLHTIDPERAQLEAEQLR